MKQQVVKPAGVLIEGGWIDLEGDAVYVGGEREDDIEFVHDFENWIERGEYLRQPRLELP